MYLGFLVPGVVTTPNRRTFQPCFYGCAHVRTECRVHVKVIGVRYV